MDKFLFDPSAVVDLPTSPIVSIPELLPFVLDDNFEPVEDFNAWLRSLRHRGVHSRRSWSGYADDVLAWATFLSRRGLRLIDDPDVLLEAVSDYRDLRLEGGPDSDLSVLGASAWNRALSALENFYAWAVDERRMASKPFRYTTLRIRTGERTGDEVEQNLAKAKGGSPLATMRSLDIDYADMFIDVGLGGALPDGSPDPSFLGRLATRNLAAGRLVRSSGLRRQEFSNLLVWEVPEETGPFGDFVALPVPASIAKGARSRTTWINLESLRHVHDYVSLERAVVSQRSSWRPGRPLVVTEPTAKSGVVNGRRVQWAKLTIEQRRRLVLPEGGSPLLFVRSDGAPVAENNWRYTFNAATDRCRTFISQFPDVSPHMMRHTMALETLNLLTRNALERADRLARVAGADPLLMAVLRRNDPLLILRDLLGHQSLHTTEIYLKAQTPEMILNDAEWELLAADDDIDEMAMTS